MNGDEGSLEKAVQRLVDEDLTALIFSGKLTSVNSPLGSRTAANALNRYHADVKNTHQEFAHAKQQQL